MYRFIVLGLAGACCASHLLAANLDLSDFKSVDLTYTYDATTLYWPTALTRFELVEVEHGQTEGGYFYASNSFCTPEHGGTHLDAPLHFSEGGLSNEQIPLERLMGPAVVIDVAAKAAVDRDYLLSMADVRQWEAKHGQIPAGATSVSMDRYTGPSPMMSCISATIGAIPFSWTSSAQTTRMPDL